MCLTKFTQFSSVLGDITTIAEPLIISIYGDWVIFGFLAVFFKFWFSIILADLNSIHKFPKIYISSVHPINFQFCQSTDPVQFFFSGFPVGQ